MQYYYATLKQIPSMADAHPELYKQRPDLCNPKFPEFSVSADPDFPFVFYAVEDGRVVGSRRAFPDRLIFAGSEYPWAWCFDTYVDNSQQGKGIGSELVRLQVEVFNRLGVISGAAFSAPAMMRIYEKFGYCVLEFTPRMTIVRNATPFVSKYLKNRMLSGIIGTMASMALRVPIVIGEVFTSGKVFELVEIDRGEFAQLFEDGEYTEQPKLWASDAQWVLSRLQSNDVCLKLIKAGSPSPLAIAVMRSTTDDSHGRLGVSRLSLMYFKLSSYNDAARGLSLSLIRELFKAKRDVADVIASSPSLLSALKAHGFRKRGTGMTFVYKLPSGIDFDGGGGIGDWHLTHFCSDGFSFT